MRWNSISSFLHHPFLTQKYNKKPILTRTYYRITSKSKEYQQAHLLHKHSQKINTFIVSTQQITIKTLLEMKMQIWKSSIASITEMILRHFIKHVVYNLKKKKAASSQRDTTSKIQGNIPVCN